MQVSILAACSKKSAASKIVVQYGILPGNHRIYQESRENENTVFHGVSSFLCEFRSLFI